MGYAVLINNEPVEIFPGKPFASKVGDRLINHPANWHDAWSVGERNAAGVKEVLEPSDPIPAGKRVAMSNLAWNNVAVSRVRVLEYLPIEERRAAICGAINALRDARIDGGFTHQVDGVTYVFQSAPSDRENIAALGEDAKNAIAAGAQPGDLLWNPNQPGVPFGFITMDNSTVAMDAFQMLDLRKRGGVFKTAQTMFAYQLKQAVGVMDHAALDALDHTAGWPV